MNDKLTSQNSGLIDWLEIMLNDIEKEYSILKDNKNLVNKIMNKIRKEFGIIK